MKYCSKCGSQIPDDAQFCGGCGAKVVEEKNISPSTTTNSSPSVSSNGIVLESPEPVPSRIISDSSADSIGGIGMIIGGVGFVVQFLQFTDSYYTIGRLGLGMIAVGGVLVIINRILYAAKGRTEEKDLEIMRTHLSEIREMKFKFIGSVSAGAIYEKISPAIKSQYENKFEFDRQNETVALIYEGTIYKIILNDDNTFCIWWARLDNKPLDKIEADDRYSIYGNILSCTGIIAYEIQKQFGVN